MFALGWLHVKRQGDFLKLMFFKKDDPFWEDKSILPSSKEEEKPASFVASKPAPAWPGWLVLIYIQAVLLVLLFVILLSLKADHSARACLAFCEPFIDKIVEYGKSLIEHAAFRSQLLGWGTFFLSFTIGIIGLVRHKKRGVRPYFLFMAAGLAALAQMSYFLNDVSRGSFLYSFAFLVLIGWRCFPKSYGPQLDFELASSDESSSHPKSQLWVHFVEAGFLLVISLVVIIYRFYALNQLPTLFDGEMVASMAVSTNPDSAFKLNYQFVNPFGWAPLGLIYFIMMGKAIYYFGSSLLTIRMLSAIVGVVLFNLVYYLLRRMGGRFAAITGSSLFAFSTIEIAWGRFDFFPFSYPSVFVILVCITSYLAFVKEKLLYFVLTAITMGLTYYLYPSGQVGFLIPVGVFFWAILTQKGFFKRCWWKLTFILIGVMLWVLGASVCAYLANGSWKLLNPLADEIVSQGTNRGQALWTIDKENWGIFDKLFFLIQNVFGNVVELVKSIHVSLVLPNFRATPIYGIPGHPATYLSGMVAVFIFMGAVVSLLSPTRKNTSFVLMWILVAMLPGILSSSPAARRLATLFPALYVLAGLVIARGLKAVDYMAGKWTGYLARGIFIMVVIPFFAIINGGWYFKQPIYYPPSTQMSQAIKPYVQPGSMVVAEIGLSDPYRLVNEVTFTLLDELSRPDKPAKWHLPRPEEWPWVAFNPKVNLDFWHYRHTKLSSMIPYHGKHPEWNRLTYIIHDMPDNQKKIELLQQIHPRAIVSHHDIYSQYDFYAIQTHYNSATIKQNVQPVAACKGVVVKGNQLIKNINVSIDRKASQPDSYDKKIEIESGLWVSQHDWLAFRIIGGGRQVKLFLNDQPVQQHQLFPMTEGINKLKIVMRQPSQLPIDLQFKIHPGNAYKTISSTNLLSPRLANVESLKPQPTEVYKGFHPPQKITTLDTDFNKDHDVSPSGRLVAMARDEDRWRLRVLNPQGKLISEWEHPLINIHHEVRYGVCFIGDETLAVLDSPSVLFYDINGNLLNELKLEMDVHGGLDIDANPAGEVFVACVDQQCVFYINSQTLETQRFRAKTTTNGSRWVPRTLSASANGHLAVLDDRERIHFFQKSNLPETPYQWKRVHHLEYNMNAPRFDTIRSTRFQVDDNGWLFLKYLPESEFRVMDQHEKRRIASNPENDLSLLLKNKCHQVMGFDEQNRLYIWNLRSHEILRLAPIE